MNIKTELSALLRTLNARQPAAFTITGAPCHRPGYSSLIVVYINRLVVSDRAVAVREEVVSSGRRRRHSGLRICLGRARWYASYVHSRGLRHRWIGLNRRCALSIARHRCPRWAHLGHVTVATVGSWGSERAEGLGGACRLECVSRRQR